MSSQECCFCSCLAYGDGSILYLPSIIGLVMLVCVYCLACINFCCLFYWFLSSTTSTRELCGSNDLGTLQRRRSYGGEDEDDMVTNDEWQEEYHSFDAYGRSKHTTTYTYVHVLKKGLGLRLSIVHRCVFISYTVDLSPSGKLRKTAYSVSYHTAHDYGTVSQYNVFFCIVKYETLLVH